MAQRWVERKRLSATVRASLRSNPVTALLGPRQCGKTTLARRIAYRAGDTFFDLESPRDLARLENPQLALEPLRGTVVLDEIQQRPELLPVLRTLADRRPLPARFLILGSASPNLVRRSSESLAGRVRFVDMGGFTLYEAGPQYQARLWLRGGFPNSYLARSDSESFLWRESFIRTFLERDIPLLDIQIPASTLRRFWTMVAHVHGQAWNSSDVASSLGLAHTTARRYLDLLSGACMVRQLPPWFENLGKRLVKAPKVFIRDSGLLHALLNVPDAPSLESHPKLGSSWEGFALEHVLQLFGERDAYFWATHAGAELDLLLIRRGKKWGFEFKYSDAPKITKSMHVALSDLKLERLWVVHPTGTRYRLHEKVDCIGLTDLPTLRQLG